MWLVVDRPILDAIPLVIEDNKRAAICARKGQMRDYLLRCYFRDRCDVPPSDITGNFVLGVIGPLVADPDRIGCIVRGLRPRGAGK